MRRRRFPQPCHTGLRFGRVSGRLMNHSGDLGWTGSSFFDAIPGARQSDLGLRFVIHSPRCNVILRTGHATRGDSVTSAYCRLTASRSLQVRRDLPASRSVGRIRRPWFGGHLPAAPTRWWRPGRSLSLQSAAFVPLRIRRASAFRCRGARCPIDVVSFRWDRRHSIVGWLFLRKQAESSGRAGQEPQAALVASQRM